jgi:plastocyanin
MRLAVAALVIAVAVAIAVPVPSGAAPTATPSAKHRCKHKKKRHHRKRKKRCQRKGAAGTAPVDGKAEQPGKTSQPSGPPGRLLATSLEISPTQLQLQLSRGSVAAGPTIVQQYNAGSDPHNLIIQRQGTVAFSFPTLDPGLNQRQTVDLTPGTWTLYCSLLNHQALGMQATLKVN